MSLLDQIQPDKVPAHVSIIMDGNGRWAKSKGKPRVFGHKNGVESVRAAVRGCRKAGVKYLTLYAFSTENWSRPSFEVNALMELLVHSLRKETKELLENGVRLDVIGNVDTLPAVCRRELKEGMELTSANTDLHLYLALSYSGRWDITQATRKVASKMAAGVIKAEDVNDELISDHLSTAGIPDPELMIRTSGEHRLSNFLLWQHAYAELSFLPIHWPEFREEHLYQALLEYQGRERRFGKTSEQLEVK